MQIHIDRSGQRFGPYPIEQINVLLADGTLLETDLGWTDGMAEWLPLSQLQGVILPGQPPAADTKSGMAQSSGSRKKKLMIGAGATVGAIVLALAAWFIFGDKKGGMEGAWAYDYVGESPEKGKWLIKLEMDGKAMRTWVKEDGKTSTDTGSYYIESEMVHLYFDNMTSEHYNIMYDGSLGLRPHPLRIFIKVPD